MAAIICSWSWPTVPQQTPLMMPWPTPIPMLFQPLHVCSLVFIWPRPTCGSSHHRELSWYAAEQMLTMSQLPFQILCLFWFVEKTWISHGSQHVFFRGFSGNVSKTSKRSLGSVIIMETNPYHSNPYQSLTSISPVHFHTHCATVICMYHGLCQVLPYLHILVSVKKKNSDL